MNKFIISIIFIFHVSTGLYAEEDVNYEYKVQESNRLVGPFLKRLGETWAIETMKEFIAPIAFNEPVYRKMIAKVKDAGAFNGCNLNVGTPIAFPDPESNVAVGGICNYENRKLAIVIIMRVKSIHTQVMAVIIGKPKNT